MSESSSSTQNSNAIDSSKNDFECFACLRKFREKSLCVYHVLQEHTNIDPLVCDCGTVFYDPKDLELHKKYCGISVQEISLNYNEQLPASETRTSQNEVTLIDSSDHVNEPGAQQQNTSNNGNEVILIDLIIDDEKTEVPENAIQGKIINEQELNQMLPEFRTYSSLFKCRNCHKSFKTDIFLKAHVKSCGFLTKKDQPKLISCDMCPKVFSELRFIRKHIKTHIRNPTTDSSLKCKVCSKEFKSEAYLSTHIEKVHQEVRMYKCEICSSEFIYNLSLKWHLINVHNEEAPYNCSICKRKYINNGLYMEHLKGHQESLAVNCELCGAKVSHRRYMKRHMKVHSGVKPFTCGDCNQSFRERHHLNKHIAAMHQEDSKKKKKKKLND